MKANASANRISIGGARFENHSLFEVSFVRSWLLTVVMHIHHYLAAVSIDMGGSDAVALALGARTRHAQLK